MRQEEGESLVKVEKKLPKIERGSKMLIEIDLIYK